MFAGQAYGNAVGIVAAEELEDEDEVVDDETGESEDDAVLEIDKVDDETTLEDSVVDS